MSEREERKRKRNLEESGEKRESSEFGVGSWERRKVERGTSRSPLGGLLIAHPP
jgi:hypothetical protein